LSITIGYPVWPFPSSTTVSYIPRMANVGFRFTQLIAQPLGQTAKTAITASRPQRKSQNSPAACRLSGKAESGERYLCVMPA